MSGQEWHQIGHHTHRADARAATAVGNAESFMKEKKKSEFKPTVITIGLENILSLRASGIIMNTNDLEEAEQLLEAAK